VLARWYQKTLYKCPGCGEEGWMVERQLVGDNFFPATKIVGSEWASQRHCPNVEKGFVVRSTEPVLLAGELFIWDEVKCLSSGSVESASMSSAARG
jgi:hypothetical protein